MVGGGGGGVQKKATTATKTTEVFRGVRVCANE